MKPEQILRIEILRELAAVPVTYLQTDQALRASIVLLMVPPPSSAQITAALSRLEADDMVHCEVSPLRGKVWNITTAGRAALAEIPS